MSAQGQKQTYDWRPLMSALPPEAAAAVADRRGSLGPKPDSCSATKITIRLRRRQHQETSGHSVLPAFEIDYDLHRAAASDLSMGNALAPR